MGTQAAGPDDAQALPTHCENCAAALHGEFCHACGQSIHNPIRHLGHAIEEFFEAFWHLDGRLFRTLRDLWTPGRVAINYLAGHRARYIAPLRLFVVTSVLTFFVGALVVHVDESSTDVSGVESIVASPASTRRRPPASRSWADPPARTATGPGPTRHPRALPACSWTCSGTAANGIRRRTRSSWGGGRTSPMTG